MRRALLLLALLACDRIDPMVRDYQLEASSPGSGCVGRAQLDGSEGRYGGGFAGTCDGVPSVGGVWLTGDRLEFIAINGMGPVADLLIEHATVLPGRKIEGEAQGWKITLTAIGGAGRPTSSPN